MPHLTNTIDGLRRQTYRNFELLVQDGGSSDATLAYLASVTDLPRINIASQLDAGIGQAYNRGILRSKGQLICLIAADEVLDDDALEKCIRWHHRNPAAAAVYGGMRLVDGQGQLSVFIPQPFDLMRFLCNETFPTTAGLLVREKIGTDLYYDEALRTCPDYDFWIRLGSRFGPRQLVAVPDPILTARGDRTSMSYRVESFDEFTRDKLFVLDRYLRSLGDESRTAALRRTAEGGILTWAAEMSFNLVGLAPEFFKWCAAAAKVDPHSPRLLQLAKKSEAFQIGAAAQFQVLPPPQPLAPKGRTDRVEPGLDISKTYTLPQWADSAVVAGRVLRVRTRRLPWSYAALIPTTDIVPSNDRWVWVRLGLRVVAGQVGIGLFASNDVFSERLVSAGEATVDVYVRLNQSSPAGIMIRNGSLPGKSAVEILGATIESAPRPPIPRLTGWDGPACGGPSTQDPTG